MCKANPCLLQTQATGRQESCCQDTWGGEKSGVGGGEAGISTLCYRGVPFSLWSFSEIQAWCFPLFLL